MLLGVDVGGTFTDAVLAVGDRLVTAKAPTTPEDQSEGVLAAVTAVLERAGAAAEDVREFAHGTTAATNALLQGEGARTVFVATEGFEDIVELARQARADLYRLCLGRPAPLVPPERRVGARERMTPDGPDVELDADAAVDAVARLEPESSPSACCTPTATLSTSGRSARRWPSGCPACTSRSATRSSARSASTSARRPPSSTPPSRPCWPRICDG